MTPEKSKIANNFAQGANNFAQRPKGRTFWEERDEIFALADIFRQKNLRHKTGLFAKIFRFLSENPAEFRRIDIWHGSCYIL
ncbi:MAG: hypothetical protein IKY08_05130 [Firmicutes bacterium]|nr:hypothetical protein [Bacillota bacterium]